jgi:hypothetical protein
METSNRGQDMETSNREGQDMETNNREGQDTETSKRVHIEVREVHAEVREIRTSTCADATDQNYAETSEFGSNT